MKRSFVLLTFMIGLLALNAFAKSGNGKFAKHFNQTENIAIHGYDVVSYFEGTPTLGTLSFAANYKGVTFLFSSEQNVNTFSASPTKYIPQYGGWCATAMGMMNMKLDVTPDSFIIYDGKLYLFSTSMGPARDQWIESMPDIKDQADLNWQALYQE